MFITNVGIETFAAGLIAKRLVLFALPEKVFPSDVILTTVKGAFNTVFAGTFLILRFSRLIFTSGLILSNLPLISTFIETVPEFTLLSFSKAA